MEATKTLVIVILSILCFILTVFSINLKQNNDMLCEQLKNVRSIEPAIIIQDDNNTNNQKDSGYDTYEDRKRKTVPRDHNFHH
jgi:hypothetical protein